MKILDLLRAVAIATPLASGGATLAADIDPHSPDAIIARHMNGSANNDLAGVMGDYAPDAIVISPSGVIRGTQAIRAVFVDLFKTPAAQRPALKILHQYTAPGLAYVTWVQNEGSANQVKGSDTLVIRDGKIIAQTVVSVP